MFDIALASSEARGCVKSREENRQDELEYKKSFVSRR